MPDQQTRLLGHLPAPVKKRFRYTPASILAAPLSLPIALTVGKALRDTMGWDKLETVAGECLIGVVAALLIAVGVNFFFGKMVEVSEKTS